MCILELKLFQDSDDGIIGVARHRLFSAFADFLASLFARFFPAERERDPQEEDQHETVMMPLAAAELLQR